MNRLTLLTPLAARALSLMSIAALVPMSGLGCASDGSSSGAANGGGSAINDPLVSTANVLNTALAPAIASDARVDGYLRDVDARFTAAAAARGSPGITPAVHIARPGSTKLLNVATLGAGHIYITSDLFQFCTSEEEFAACLSRGFAQAVLRQKRLATDLVARAAKPGDQSAEQIALAASQSRPTAADEQEADRVAYELFARGGWDPDRYGDVFQRLADNAQTPAAAVAILKRRASMRVKLPSTAGDWRERSVVDESSFRDMAQRLAAAPARPAGGDPRAESLLLVLPNNILGADQPEQVAATQKLTTQLQEAPKRGRDWKGGGGSVVPQ